MAQQVLSLDTETCRFGPGNMAPRLVCVTYKSPGSEASIQTADDAESMVEHWFRQPDLIITGCNIAYDTVVFCANYPRLIPFIFEAYDQDKITDVMWRQKLLDIAGGCYRGRIHSDGCFQPYQYDLASLAKRLAGIHLVKDDTRLGYGDLLGISISEWPERAVSYALEDASATLACYLAQEEHRAFLLDQYRQARAYFALHLMETWGIRTSAEAVRKLSIETSKARDDVMLDLVSAGLVRPNGTRDTKAAGARMESVMGQNCPRTPTGKPALGGEHCTDSEDPILMAYGEYTTLNKVLSTDVPQMSKGIVEPIHCHYDLAATGRTTCASPNLQNLRRLPGVREAYVPREGHVFIDADYNALELWALAQVQIYLFGHSTLADVLNAGKDPHTALGADILGITYEEAATRKKNPEDHDFSNARQAAKACNFGFPGGLGAEKMTWFAKQAYGISFTIERAQELRDAWFKRWPEMRQYFQWVGQQCEEGEFANVEVPVANFFRGRATFTAAANTMFQGLAAAAAKHAAWLLARACYVNQGSPLYGSRPVCFVHDQFIIETPDNENAHEAAMSTRWIMREACRNFMPDCIPEVEPLLSRFWSKDAHPILKEGKLVPWPQ